MTQLELLLENNRKLYLNEYYLSEYKEDLLSFLEEQDYMKTIEFSKNTMMPKEIKANNSIEGIKDDINLIEQIVKRGKKLKDKDCDRILNLYKGYRYILKQSNINKETLKELYTILSKGMLNETDLLNMGEFYREGPVFIINGSNLSETPIEGVDYEKVEYYMNMLFSYIDDISDKTEIDSFIKSQIIHFYFVYIHPYFDVNGRTSRTVAMWYLLNNKAYPYIAFNRAIAFAKSDYYKKIMSTRKTNDITLFLEYMLMNVKKELEKEYVIHNIKETSTLTVQDCEIIEYLLTLNGNTTVKDLACIYNRYNAKKRITDILDDSIEPLLEKGILVNAGYTKGHINKDLFNFELRLNSDKIDVDPQKVKYLDLTRYL